MGIGMKELLVILVLVLLVFGAKKLKTIGSDLGAAVRGFKKSMDEGEQEGHKQIKSDEPDAEFAKESTDKADKKDRVA